MATHNARLVRAQTDDDPPVPLVLIEARAGEDGLAMLFPLDDLKDKLDTLDMESDITALEVGVLGPAPQVIVPGRGGRV